MAIAKMARQPLQSAGPRNLRLQYLCGLRRRLHDGRASASEAASLAGHLGLDNLCWIYDNNHITIEGNTRITFTEDIAARFLAYGWNVLRVGDANDMDRIEHALDVFRKTKERPTFIILDSQSVTARRTSKIPPRLMANRWAKRKFASSNVATDGRRTPNSWSPTGSTNTCGRYWDARVPRPRAVDATLRRISVGVSRARARDRFDAAPRVAARMGPGLPTFPADPEGRRGTRSLGQGAKRAGAERPVASRRFGRSRVVEQDRVEVRRRRAISRPAPPGGRESALRRSRARNGGHRQRTVPVEAAGLRRHLLHLQRLRAAGHPAFRPDGTAYDLRVHARRHG